MQEVPNCKFFETENSTLARVSTDHDIIQCPMKHGLHACTVALPFELGREEHSSMYSNEISFRNDVLKTGPNYSKLN